MKPLLPRLQILTSLLAHPHEVPYQPARKLADYLPYDIRTADEFIARYGWRLRYAKARWLIYCDGRWRIDGDNVSIVELFEEFRASLLTEANQIPDMRLRRRALPPCGAAGQPAHAQSHPSHRKCSRRRGYSEGPVLCLIPMLTVSLTGVTPSSRLFPTPGKQRRPTSRLAWRLKKFVTDVGRSLLPGSAKNILRRSSRLKRKAMPDPHAAAKDAIAPIKERAARQLLSAAVSRSVWGTARCTFRAHLRRH